MSALRHLGLAAILLAAAPWPASARPGVIEGTLRLNGCIVAPSKLRLAAEPLRFEAPDFRPPRIDPPTDRLEAVFERTPEPHVYRFLIDAVQPATLYRLRVAAPQRVCGRVFWRGPSEGLAVAGESSVAIEGFAARTTVEVAELGSRNWVGADDLRFDDPVKAVRRFRFRSTLEGVVGGELQVSTEPFPLEGAFGPCDEPRSGIVVRRRIAATPRGAIADVDFHEILVPRRDDSRSSDLDERTYVRLLASKPVYVRVVPERTDGPACDVKQDGVHGWVMLAKLPGGSELPLPQIPNKVSGWYDQRYTPPYLGAEGFGHPTYRERAFKVIKPHKLHVFCSNSQVFLNDPMGCFIVNAGWWPAGSTIEPGVWFYYTPNYGSGGGGGFFDGLVSSFSNLATATVGALGVGVQFLHDLYEEVKKGVAGVIVDVIQILPGDLKQACDALAGASGEGDCQALVQAGLETGLASMGIPPSLPNWDQLKDQGIEYLASVVAAEIVSGTGVPVEFTEQQLAVLAKSAIDKMGEQRKGAGLKNEWLLPYAGFEPAVWSLTIKKDSSISVPSGVHVVTKHYGLYQGANVVLPTEFPASGILRVPIVLRPSYTGIKAPYCYTDWMGNVSCKPLGSKPICVWQVPTFDGYSYESLPCLDHTLGVYYRNAWIAKKFFPTKCATLHASAAQGYAIENGIALPWPFDKPFLDVAVVNRHLPAEWDGWLYFGCK